MCELLPAVCRVGPVQTLLPTSHSELGQSRNLPPAADISQNTSSLAVSAMPSVYRYSSYWDNIQHHKHSNSTILQQIPVISVTSVTSQCQWWTMWTSHWPGGYQSQFSFKDNRQLYAKPMQFQAVFCLCIAFLMIISCFLFYLISNINTRTNQLEVKFTGDSSSKR